MYMNALCDDHLFYLQCDDFVKSYGPDVVEIIANYIDPKTMCQVSN